DHQRHHRCVEGLQRAAYRHAGDAPKTLVHHGCEIRSSTMYDFAYQKPSSLADAVKALSGDADAKALAGGMTLIPVLKQRLNKPSLLVDLAKLGLVGVTVSGNTVTIAGMTTHGAVASNAALK